MAWEDGPDGKQWSELVVGLRWKLNAVKGEYYFEIEEAGSAPADLDHGLELEDKPAADWARDHPTLWGSVVALPEEDDDGDGEAHEQPAVVAPVHDQPAADAPAAALRLADPTVVSSGAPTHSGVVAFRWLARFTVSDVQTSASWIIQEVVVDGDETFYEAFPVAANATETADEDVYECSSAAAGDEYTVVGAARHYVFGNGANPPGFGAGEGDADVEQLSTTDRPDWWAGNGGTEHNLTYDAGPPVTITTVPESGAPEAEGPGGGSEASSGSDNDGDASPAPKGSASPAPSGGAGD